MKTNPLCPVYISVTLHEGPEEPHLWLDHDAHIEDLVVDDHIDTIHQALEECIGECLDTPECQQGGWTWDLEFTRQYTAAKYRGVESANYHAPLRISFYIEI